MWHGRQGELIYMISKGNRMKSYTKKQAIELYEGHGMNVPQFVLSSIDSDLFAMGWTPAGHVPFHKVGSQTPKAISRTVSIRPQHYDAS